MRYLFFLLKAVFSLYGLVLFILVMLLVFPFVVVCSFFGKIRGGNMIYKLCKLWADVVFVCWGMVHKNYFESPHDIDRQYVFVFNHISYMDIPVILKAVRGQHFRILGKSDMAKIPLFGFIYRNAVVMVDRASAAKRANSVMQLKSILRKNISVVISPEGTFNYSHQPLKSFYDGAFRIAIETQTPVKPVLFLDTFYRMHYSTIFSLTPGRSRAVFLEEISVDGLTLKDLNFLKEKVYRIMEEKLIFYKAGWIEGND